LADRQNPDPRELLAEKKNENLSKKTPTHSPPKPARTGVGHPPMPENWVAILQKGGFRCDPNPIRGWTS